MAKRILFASEISPISHLFQQNYNRESTHKKMVLMGEQRAICTYDASEARDAITKIVSKPIQIKRKYVD